MPPSGLSPLQDRILGVLAGLAPEWTLSGGAALVGVHGVRRTTRDIDLFFHALESLGRVPEEVASRLLADGLETAVIQSGGAFHRLRVSDGSEVVIVDLIADPVHVVEPPVAHDWSGKSILVDTPHEILVNKLCALLGRSELRDLADVSDLLERGGDLRRALTDAPRKDGGFSPLTLAWVLETLPLASLAEVDGLLPEDTRRLETSRKLLVSRISEASRPDA